MPHNLVIILALAIPAIVFVVLRINAAMVFLSLCLGAVLVQSVASQANDMIGLFAPKVGSVSASSIQLALLVAPAIVTSVVTVFSIHGKVRTVLNAVPAIAGSMLAFLLVVPILTPNVRAVIMAQPVWHVLSRAEALIVGLGSLVTLFFLWTQRQSFRGHGKGKH